MVIVNNTSDVNEIDFLAGAAILVDKPREWTSFDVVNKLRNTLCRRLNIRKMKVGHAGTLDPLATGLLIICTGKATKKIIEFQDQKKGYTGEIKFGATTNTYDAEGAEENQTSIDELSLAVLQSKTELFKGDIMQMPPIFSAIKVKGKALYKYARRDQKVEIQARAVQIYNFDIDRYDPPMASFQVSCSKGTYIRSLAHDIGQEVGTGAYLHALCRTSIGSYENHKAFQLDQLVDLLTNESS